MKKLMGLSAMLFSLVILLGTVVAQDAPPAKGGFGGGKGGGGFGGKGLAPDAFMTKYDANKDGKVTKDEYLKVASDDAKTAWEKIDTKKTGTVSTEDYTKYYDELPAVGGAGKGGAGKGGAGKGGKGKGAGAPGA